MKILATHPGVTQFVEGWRRSFLQVLSEAGVAGATIETVNAKSCADIAAQMKEKHYCATLSASGDLKGTMMIVLSEPEALQLSLLVTRDASNRASQRDDAQRGAVAELINRVAAALMSSPWVKGTAKLEIIPSETGNAEPDLICEGLRIGAENFKPVTIVLAPSTDLAESLKALVKEASAVSPTGKASGESTMSASQAAGSSSNLDLLFDVKLEATIRFGGRQLLLRDILSMSAGSVIELDRQVGEPAELLVAGRLVARGEVVVVDGKFGLRVTELPGTPPQPDLLKA